MITIRRERVSSITEFIASLFQKVGFTPNGLTIFGTVTGVFISILFIWNRNPALFGILILLNGLLDSIDGALARITNNCTKYGSYLDAVCDRFYEIVAVLAAAYVSGHWVLSYLLISGSLLTSYLKSRTAMEVNISNTEWPDLMQRFERSFLFALGLVLWGFFPLTIAGKDFFFFSLIVINLCVYGGVVQRFVRAKRLIEERS